MACPRSARADGAFPDAQSVLLPRDRPDEIILATNFGLVFSEDDGMTWNYTCETDAQTQGGNLYIMGPPTMGGVSGDRLFAVSIPPPGAPVSLDDGCSWMQAGGALTDPANPALASDVFPDPANVSRVFVLAIPGDPPDAPGSVYRSLDGGLTYVGPLYTPPDDGARPRMTGIEVSASTAGIVYATWYDRVGDHPHLTTSTDGGSGWSDALLDGQLGLVKPYLAGIDPTDSQTIVLRVISADNSANPFEGLARTRDGGRTWTMPLQIPGGTLAGFVRRQDGSLVAIGTMKSTDGTVPASYLFRSVDDGQTFSMEPLPFHGKGLAERDGTLFMATDNFQDLVALVSSEDGKNWKARMRFDQISAIKACVFASCRDSCDLLGGLTIFPPQTCDTAAETTPKSAGSGGCGCAAAPSAGRTPAPLGLLAVLALPLVVRPRRKRRDAP
jgi:MYXO-CTERM domain-containing protein